MVSAFMKKRTLVILCGGRSTRMGSDKTFLPFGSQSLLRYQLERFRPYFSQIFLSVPKHSSRPFDYEDYCGCRSIEDIYENIGPMGGLYSCMQALNEDILFFTSVDAPFTDPELAGEMTDQLRANPHAQICSIRSPKGQLQPLFAAYRRTCLPRLQELITARNYRLRELFDPAHTLVLDRFLPPEQFFNMNDPASYYYALHKLALRQPGVFPADFNQSFAGTPASDSPSIPVLSFTAKSGTGKTTFLEKLLPLLKKQGLRIAVVKHDAHGFEIDHPGKDSYRLTKAGADHMILTSEDQTAAIITHRHQHPELESVLARIRNVDLIITEGYKLGRQKKIHLLRRGYSETPVGNQENVIAYLTDFPYESQVPVFDLNRPEGIVPFLLDYLRDASNQCR